MILKKPSNESIFLLILLFIALGVRLLPLRFEYLLGSDPYFHYSNFKDLAESGHLLFPLGIYSPALLVNSITGFIGFSNYDAFRITAPIFGVMTIFIVYLMAREIFNIRIALASAFILAFTPAFIIRTAAANYRGDPFSMFFVVLGFYFFLNGIRQGLARNRIYMLRALGGFSLALAAFVWSSGYIFGVMIVTVYVLITSISSFFYNKNSMLKPSNYFIFISTSILLIYSFNYLGVLARPISSISGFSDFSRFIFPATMLILVFFEVIKRKAPLDINKRLLFIILFGFISSTVLFYAVPDFFDNIANLYRKNYTSMSTSYQFTGELLSLDKAIFLENFNIVWIFSVFGLFFIIIKRFFSQNIIFLFLWLLAGIYLMLKIGLRGTFFAAIPVSIFAGYGIQSLAGSLDRLKLFDIIGKIRLSNIFIFILLLSVAFFGIDYSVKLSPAITDDWVDALEWQKENLPEDSVILSWWNYGYWISSIGEGKTIIDGGQNQKKVKEVADIFLEDDRAKIVEYLINNRVDYIIISSELIGQITSIQEIHDPFSEYPSLSFLPYYDTKMIKGSRVDNFGGALLLRTDAHGNRSAMLMKSEKLYGVKVFYWDNGAIKEIGPSEETGLIFQDGSFYVSHGELSLTNTRIEGEYYKYQNIYAIYIPKEIENKLLISLLFKNGINFHDMFTLVYSNPQIKIYKTNINITKIGSMPKN